MSSYGAPVDRLLRLGRPEPRYEDWLDYPATFSLGPRHAAALARMARDPALLNADPAAPQVWAPVHAWRALGQLRGANALEPVLGMLRGELDEWAAEDLPHVFALLGTTAIPPLAAVLRDRGRGEDARLAAAGGLARIAAAYPETRDECVRLLTRPLEGFAPESGFFNGRLVRLLISLNAGEAARPMEAAFAGDRVDLAINGDWDDVQVALGLLPARRTPRGRTPLWCGVGQEVDPMHLIQQMSEGRGPERRGRRPAGRDPLAGKSRERSA